jgi:NADPH:quinone reductase-like Zn-dependent oxidoreductase
MVEQMNAVPTVGSVVSRTMHAIVRRQYGTPDVLKYEEIERPVPGSEDVLIRVLAAGVSVGDHIIVTGKPYLIRLTPFGGIPRPRNRVPGACMAGRVEAVGANVTTFRPGDEVFGEATTGAFSEYLVVRANLIAPKPTNLSFEEAAAVPWAVAALQGLRDVGKLRAGQKVLINGASGGVGTWAVQIAKALGANVTAVCSTRNKAMVRALGADVVIDYSSENFVEGVARFDLMLDMVGNRSLTDCRSVLTPEGTYVSCSGGDSGVGWLLRMAAVSLTSLFTRQTLAMLFTTPNQDDLLFLKALVEAGDLKPIIERRYPLTEVAEALRHVGGRHSQGQTIIQIAS